jgi:hypothetical protein
MIGDPVQADHVFARNVALALYRGGVPTSLYADLPYAVRFGWPHWVTGTSRNPRLNVDAYWDRFVKTVSELEGVEPRIVRLSATMAERKLNTLSLYRTQFPGLDALGLLSNSGVLGFEVYWDLTEFVTPGRSPESSELAP